MVAQSPPSPTSSAHTLESVKSLTEWDEEEVVQLLLAKVGLEEYAEAFRGNGIDGGALTHLDHEALREMGVTSVGKRLALLRAIYEGKLSESLPLEEGDWLPPFTEKEPTTARPSPPPTYREHRCRSEAHEGEISELRDQVDSLEELVHALAGRFIESENTINELKRTRPKSNTIHKPALSVDTAKAAAKPSRAMPSPQKIKSPPKTPDSATLMPSALRTPPKTNKSRGEYFDEGVMASPLRSAARSGRIFDSEIIATTPMLGTGVNTSPGKTAPASARSSITPALVRPAAPTRSNSSRSAKQSSSSNDTCLTILPAAVRKYKLKSSWTDYVMIVSCASHKRALSYDERPRVVVEELRLSGEKPSCLVQHQSELRSPLALAHSRRSKAFKRLLNSSEGNASDEPLHQHIPTAAVESKSPAPAGKFAMAIYPYQSEGSKETDLDYGMVYALSSTTGDTATVQRLYPSSTGVMQTGIVPSRCLLELTHPPDMIAPSPAERTGKPVARSIDDLDTDSIASSFALCHALLDRTAHGAGEIGMKKGDRLRVYFRCAHWSWAVTEKRDAGWVPSWLVSSGGPVSPREVPQLPTRKPSH